MSEETELDPGLVEELRTIEREMERSSLPARWECGHRILKHYPDGKKQLPNGVLDAIAKTLGIARSEVGARVRFARQFTEAQVNTCVESGRWWTEIRQKELTKTPRPHKPKPPVSPWKRIVDVLENVDRQSLGHDDLTAIQMIRKALDDLCKDISNRESDTEEDCDVEDEVEGSEMVREKVDAPASAI